MCGLFCKKAKHVLVEFQAPFYQPVCLFSTDLYSALLLVDPQFWTHSPVQVMTCDIRQFAWFIKYGPRISL